MPIRKRRPAPSTAPAPSVNHAVVPEGRRSCPICQRAMVTTRRGEDFVDVCGDHGIWLDKGELERMLLRRARAAGHRLRRTARHARARTSALWWALLC